MRKKFLHDISTNFLQVIINQACGIVMFYILSVFLNKNDFGELNWSLAVLLTAFNILSFGIDQVSIKKFVSGKDTSQVLSIYIIHIMLAGILFYSFLLSGRYLFKGFLNQHQLLLFLGIGKLAIFFSTPFKQLANGLERFKPLLLMSVCSNVIRSIALLLLALLHTLNLSYIIIIFISGDVAELLLSVLVTKFIIKTPIALKLDKRKYIETIKESIPLMGVAVFTSVIARFDWIFLGLLTTDVILANYSFAYKVFEISTLPMLAIAPILIPKFTRLFNNSVKDVSLNKLYILLRLEIIVASLIGLILNIVWVPAIDLITKGKYGAVNQVTFLILSCCTPLLYFNNFLWTIHFARGSFKLIFKIIAITFLINVIGDVILILLFKAEGAAIAFFIAMLIQFILYFRKINVAGIRKSWKLLIIIPLFAVAADIISQIFFTNYWLILFAAVLLFMLALFISKQLYKNDWQLFRQTALTDGNHFASLPD
jgi:O-antigen/teichoic acid export membrane protein